MSAEDMVEYNELKTLIVDQIDAAIAAFTLGDRSLDEFGSFCSELEAMGLERYVELAQTAYDAL